ncbi:MAG: type secretion system protein VirD4 [Pyrinomonadaceae bacterium]|jgi:type IV secretion system protein VirD4|nr:type secretion system protein VirD4 [Pyrinomonadaceae bacterium]
MFKVLTLIAKGVVWAFAGPYRILLRAGDGVGEIGWLVSRSLAGVYLLGLVVTFGSCGILARSTDPQVSYLGFATAIGVCVFGIFHINQIIGRVRSNRRAATFHGTARWATDKEIALLSIPVGKPLPDGGFYVGHHKPKGRAEAQVKVCLPRSESVLHGIVFAPPGRGKSRGYSIPNCAWAKNTSIVTTDPKSEIFSLTSGYHERVLKYAPTEVNGSEVLNWIPLCGDARMSELCARAIVESGNNEQTQQFWLDVETAFLSALFSHASTLEEPTPLTAYRLFTRQTPEDLLEQLFDSSSEAAREQAMVFAQTDPKIKGSIVPAVASKLQFLRDPNIARFTSASLKAPDFGELRRQPTAVYFCMREQDIARLRPLTSLFFSLMLEQIAGAEVPADSQGVPITMILDEFVNIGTIPEFATTISLARGRDVAIWLLVQSYSQFEARYGKANAATIITNCGTKIALSGLDATTAARVSEMLGDMTVVDTRPSQSTPRGGWRSSSTVGRTEHKRKLLTPDEVMRIDRDKAIVRIGNRHPMLLSKIYYNEPPKTTQVRGIGPAIGIDLALGKFRTRNQRKPMAVSADEFYDELPPLPEPPHINL